MESHEASVESFVPSRNLAVASGLENCVRHALCAELEFQRFDSRLAKSSPHWLMRSHLEMDSDDKDGNGNRASRMRRRLCMEMWHV